MTLPPEVAEAYALIERYRARLIVDQLRAGSDPDWIDQSASPLGTRRHCTLARRIVAEGSGDATQVGRRFLIRRERLEREMGAPSRRERAPADDLASEFGLRLVGGAR